jgi:hypothetical protein
VIKSLLTIENYNKENSRRSNKHGTPFEIANCFQDENPELEEIINLISEYDSRIPVPLCSPSSNNVMKK